MRLRCLSASVDAAPLYASSVPTFLLFIRNTDPGRSAGIRGLTLPAGLGPSTRLPVAPPPR